MFTDEELRLIVEHCIDVEEEYGSTKRNDERLLSYKIALKANSMLSSEIDLCLLESNLRYSKLI